MCELALVDGKRDVLERFASWRAEEVLIFLLDFPDALFRVRLARFVWKYRRQGDCRGLLRALCDLIDHNIAVRWKDASFLEPRYDISPFEARLPYLVETTNEVGTRER